MGNLTKTTQAGKLPRVSEIDAIGRLMSTDGKPCTHWVETGRGVIPLPKGEIAASLVKNFGFSYWNASHAVGEPLGIPPGRFLRPLGADSGDTSWLPITQKTRRWWDRAINDALGNMAARRAMHERDLDGSGSGPAMQIEKPQPPYQNKLKRPDDYYPPFPPPGGGRGGGWSDGPWRPGAGGGVVAPLPSDGGGGGGGWAASSWRLSGGGATTKLPSAPSPVGGVYLGSAAKSLEGVGLLNGITLDQNNNLILLGKEETPLALPPLRVDDVVTVFRSVYLYGEGPCCRPNGCFFRQRSESAGAALARGRPP
jgi:hypothetical protein